VARDYSRGMSNPDADAVRDATELERMIVLAQADRVTGEAVLRVFADSTVVIPSGTPVSHNLGQLQPLLFDNDGSSMLAAFSLTIVGRLLLVSMPPGAGLVLNPSRSIGFELPPEAIRLFVRDIHEQASTAGD
jgi:hypothetical protein